MTVLQMTVPVYLTRATCKYLWRDFSENISAGAGYCLYSVLIGILVLVLAIVCIPY